jgi:methylphosphotriester-DNA--protein-cysteine methyltransferase
MSPKQWMMEMKENEVRYYLKNTDYTLTKIAALLGFANVSHLWNFCIKMTGMPPNKIREDQFDQPTEEKI